MLQEQEKDSGTGCCSAAAGQDKLPFAGATEDSNVGGLVAPRPEVGTQDLDWSLGTKRPLIVQLEGQLGQQGLATPLDSLPSRLAEAQL